jgi:hypothetical protein
MRVLPFVRARRPWFPLDDVAEPPFDASEHSFPPAP